MIKIALNSRQRSILLVLLQADGFVTLASIAMQLGLSGRVVRYNLPAIETWLRQHNVSIVRIPGVGINAETSKAERKRLAASLQESEGYELVLSPQQRLRALLLELLTTLQPIASAEVARRHGQSRSTIFSDVREARAWLVPYGLKIERRPRVGTWVVGREKARRSALVHLLEEEVGARVWVEIWSRAGIKPDVSGLVGQGFKGFVETLPLGYTRVIVERIERTIGQELVSLSRVALQVHLALAVNAVQEGRVVRDLDDPEILHTPEFRVAQIAAADIESRFHLTLPMSEVQLIAVRLLGSIRARTGPDWLDTMGTMPEGGLDCEKLAQAIATKASFYLHPWLSVDQQLIRGLAMHLGPKVHQLRYGLQIRNPLLSEIKKAYPEVYDVAERTSEILTEALGVPLPEDEIGYLTMHLAAALERLSDVRGRRQAAIIECGGEVSAALLLRARLNAEFPHLEVVEIRTEGEIQLPIPPSAGLVLSTVPLHDAPLPVIQVSPLLSRADIRAIEVWLRAVDAREHKRELAESDRPTIVDLLSLSCITVGGEASSWQEVVEMAGEPLVKTGKIEQRYVTAMKELVSTYGPYTMLAHGVILLHARPSDGVSELALGLLVLRSGVPFGNVEFDPVDIAFVLATVDGRSHLNALWQLLALVRLPEVLEELRSAKSGAEVIQAIWRHLPSTELH